VNISKFDYGVQAGALGRGRMSQAAAMGNLARSLSRSAFSREIGVA
jgi:hypothetical protein